MAALRHRGSPLLKGNPSSSITVCDVSNDIYDLVVDGASNVFILTAALTAAVAIAAAEATPELAILSDKEGSDGVFVLLLLLLLVVDEAKSVVAAAAVELFIFS